MIDERYTLFIRIPLYRRGDGTYMAGDLWARDLTAHLPYLATFSICCPVIDGAPDGKAVVPVPGLTDAQVHRLREDRGWGTVARNLLPNFRAVVRALRATEIAHGDAAGWAFPLSYYILLARPFLRFRWVVLVESSPWLRSPGVRGGIRTRLSERVHLAMVRACVEAADARIFTHGGYRDLLLGRDERSLVAPAVWVEEADIRSEAEISAGGARSGPLRMLFPARLTADKGVDTLFAAVAELEARGVEVSVDIVGAGDLAERCRAFCAERSGSVRMRFREPVPYGAPFHALLREYDAALLANRKDEQPRVVLDALSQGLVCIATRTNGIAEVTREGVDSLLYPVDDGAALASLVERCARAPSALTPMKLAAVAAARDRTHRRMHLDREAFLKRVLGLGTGGKRATGPSGGTPA